MMRTFSRLMLPLLSSLALLAMPATARDAHTGTASTTLTVSGAVEQRLVLDAAALAAFPAAQIVDVSLPRGAGSAPVKYRGVRLRDVLTRAKIVAPGHNDIKQMLVVASATDQYVALFSWAELFNSPLGEGVLVLFERDGKALGDDEGKLALISTGDTRNGARHVKWLQAVEVRKIAP